MKEFSWEKYDGRKLLLCGPYHNCVFILSDFVKSYRGEIFICDDEHAGEDFIALAREYLIGCAEHLEEEGIFVREMIREDISKLENLGIRILSYREIASFREDYVILAGKTFLKGYCRALGYDGIGDFYSAVPALRSGAAKQYYFSYFTSLYRKQKKGLYLGGVEINLTKRCTLRCRECANLLQYYDRPERIPADTVIRSVKRLLAVTDGIAMFKLLGGEPLLEQDLIKEILLLSEIRDSRKVLGIQIITNGTLLFREDVLEVMRKELRLGVLLSNYGNLSPKEEALKRQLTDAGIAWSETGLRDEWCAWGDPKQIYHDGERAKYLFDYCKNKSYCCTVLDGKFYTCPRSAHGDGLGFYNEKYVDLLQAESGDGVLNGSSEDELITELREELRAYYYRTDAPEACASCTGHCGIRTQRAEQMDGRKILLR